MRRCRRRRRRERRRQRSVFSVYEGRTGARAKERERDSEADLALLLNIEALGGFDVLQVDPAEGWFHGDHHVNELVGVSLSQLDVEGVDASEAWRGSSQQWW